MHYAEIKTCDIANGPGVRTSLFVSGCTHRCKGCFNEIAWDFNYGREFTEATIKEIIDSLAPDYVTGLTLLGGEPFEHSNQQGLLPLLLSDGGGVLALLRLLLHEGCKGGRGLAHVGAGDDGGAVVQQVLDGGQGGADALVIGDDAAAVLGHGHVEVAAQQDLLAGNVHIADGLFVVVHSRFLHIEIIPD